MIKTKVLISGPGLDVLQKSGKDPCAVCLNGVSTKSISCGGSSSWVHKKCNGISGSLNPDPASGANGVLDRPDQYMADQWHRPQWVGRSLWWCHPSVTSVTDQSQVTAVNSLSSQNTVSHSANAISPRLSSPAPFPSPLGAEFIIQASEAPCSVQANPGPQTYLICIACNAVTRLWSTGCAVSPSRRKPARKISWRGCSLTIWQRYSAPVDSDCMAM